MPLLGSERPVRRQQRQAIRVRGIERDGVAPPRLDRVEANRAVGRELQAEEDDDLADREARIQRGGEDICTHAVSAPEK